MNKFSFTLVLCLLFFFGCKNTNPYGSLPSFTSSVFPSPPPVTEIKDGIKIKIVDANYKAKDFLKLTVTKGESNITYRTETDTTIDTKVDNNLVYSSNIYDMVRYSSEKRENLIGKFDCIHEINGKLVKMDLDADYLDDIPSESINTSKKRMDEIIKNRLSLAGKIINTGDILTESYSSYFNQIILLNIPFKFREVVKGLGTYKDQSCVVTELTFNVKVNDPKGGEAKGKGYALYDPLTFAQLYREIYICANGYLLELEGYVNVEIENSYERTDMKVRKIIDAPSKI